jgi:hypothetical protein
MGLKTFASACLIASLFGISIARADLIVGPISNFQDGTVQGWAGGTVTLLADSGPSGLGDFAVQLSNGGVAGLFAMYNTGVNGAISPSVGTIASDILRPAGQGSAEMRLVMFDNVGTRWTTTSNADVVDDGLWHRYGFSIRESDLTRVLGSGSYANLTANLDRIMFRFDPGAPNAGGAALDGTMNFDNISAIPEPSSIAVPVSVLLLGLMFRRRVRNPIRGQ